MRTHHIELTEAFEYIADAGYIAYNEKAVSIGREKTTLYRKFKLEEKQFNNKGKLIKKETIHTLLFPKLSAQE